MTGAAANHDPADMAPIVGRLREVVLACESQGLAPCVRTAVDPFAEAARAGLLDADRRRPEVVLSDRVSVELGAPGVASHAAVLLTRRSDLVRCSTVSLFGPDLHRVPRGASLPFAQVVILSVGPQAWPDPFAVDAAQYLTHRLPGYMTRSVPGRLWVRVSLDARSRGLTFAQVGASLMACYLQGFPEVAGVEVLFATQGEAVRALAPVCLEAEVVAGRHRKLAINDGELGCRDLACDACEEKPVCDELREMLGKRRGRA